MYYKSESDYSPECNWHQIGLRSLVEIDSYSQTPVCEFQGSAQLASLYTLKFYTASTNRSMPAGLIHV